MIRFKSVGHFFASVTKRILAAVPTVIADAEKVKGTEATVEGVTALIPTYGPMALSAENVAYALLGEAIALLKAGDAAALAKFADLGLDAKVVETVKAVANDPTLEAAARLI